ncbi:MAG: acyl CoA:acetate/3-ketoacid CoA transferase alpha subunit/acyl CoA:acetate [Myxococcota bacterium]|jgi:acyl CoA:acetate/3-ketoacid CoA transferase alpha subunit/acyl CoA:acetate/3-ketoacid CoA transferase beta subunit
MSAVPTEPRWWLGPPPVCRLDEAVDAVVEPGMHLHFSSTPSRSNAAILAIAARFQRTDPGFTLSSTGFHSVAHLLGRLRLGRRYIASFFGDNHPTPRPSRLYTTLTEEGAALEVWSLGALVSALRAGALGLPGALTRSLVGSTLGEDLAAAGRLQWTADGEAALLAPMRPDVTFLHGLVADRDGNVLFSAPRCEGSWAALGAREGAIVTVERIVEGDLCERFPESIALPAHRIRAICVAPRGASPQPLPAMPAAGIKGYSDVTDGYAFWRALASDDALWDEFSAAVLDEPDVHAAAAAFIARPRPRPRPRQLPPELPESPPVMRLALAARWIAERVREGGYPVILAGIGQSFLASRAAALQLAREGRRVLIMVETGLYDVSADDSDGYLLSYQNFGVSRRLSDVEDTLLTLTCGADSRCLGVIGVGQLDPRGDINSTRIGGRFLVGSGGANDIASSAAEVIALAPLRSDRLVAQVEHITSPGRRLLSVVTERGVLCRSETSTDRWWVEQAFRPQGLSAVLDACWPGHIEEIRATAAPLSSAERALILTLDPEGVHWNTKEQTWWSPSRSLESATTSRRAS